MSGCPNDFKAAYLAHIHAWETLIDLEQRVNNFKKERNGPGDFIEGFIRGYSGDPFGKMNEIRSAGSKLDSELQSANQQIKQTYNKVEEIAVSYGANLPTR